MAVELGTGVPWVMCKEEDAPDPVVSILALFSSISIFYYFTLFWPLMCNPKCDRDSLSFKLIIRHCWLSSLKLRFLFIAYR